MLNNNTMGLNRNVKDKPYLIGRAVAITEYLVDVPREFVALVQVNPLQKLTYHLREALKTEDEELMELAENIGDLPARLIDPKAQYYVGYYHQKAEFYRRDLGKKLAEIRMNKGLSIRQLAELAGVSFQNISKIEQGKYNVSIDILGKICESLNCRIDIVEGQ